ncbi:MULTISPECIES: hypothetical protein [unclassified Paenibacillus]|uniref:hypothetical protein n=1 Tax=unclassified Paenibacillus TaxID=185978 RepID=UPI000970D332|nr:MULTISPECIES: hypothetical protein [unclassified Paenibacillus]ASS65560.1 hypothetical protein CIC07_05000 [Paenibacillus sp. RUD330]
MNLEDGPIGDVFAGIGRLQPDDARGWSLPAGPDAGSGEADDSPVQILAHVQDAPAFPRQPA